MESTYLMINISYKKNEKFYTKKRTMLRVADQIKKLCASDIFILVHKKDSDNIFSYSTDHKFDLSRVSQLVMRDVE